MAKKENRISINKLESVKETRMATIRMSGTEDVMLTIKYNLPLKEVLEFVELVVSACIDKENGVYIPEAEQFAIDAATLTLYANLTLPENTEKKYELVYNTPVLDQVIERINLSQLNTILEIINKKIQHELNMMYSSETSKVNKLVNEIETVSEQLAMLFKDINTDDITLAFNNLSKMNNVSEEMIAHEMAKAVAEEPIDNIVSLTR